MLDKFCRPATILAANTSWLSVAAIASATYRAKQCAGVRFSNPVEEMKVLEIVCSSETDDETLAALVEVGKRMGKDIKVLHEVPGVISSRVP
jgi:3-hydroxybutyryl-CoA dehydrogenase